MPEYEWAETVVGAEEPAGALDSAVPARMRPDAWTTAAQLTTLTTRRLHNLW